MSTPALQKEQTRVGYHEIGGPNGLLANLVPFTNHTESMSAEWRRVPLPEENGEPYGPAGTLVWVYRVYSYNTVIAEWWPASSTVHLNANEYSTTTARQQTLTRAWMGRNYHHGRHATVVHTPSSNYYTRNIRQLATTFA